MKKHQRDSQGRALSFWDTGMGKRSRSRWLYRVYMATMEKHAERVNRKESI